MVESEKDKQLVAFLAVTVLLAQLLGIAATVGLFCWVLGLWTPGPIMRVVLALWVLAFFGYYVKTRGGKQAMYAFVGTAILVLFFRWLPGK